MGNQLFGTSSTTSPKVNVEKPKFEIGQADIIVASGYRGEIISFPFPESHHENLVLGIPEGIFAKTYQIFRITKYAMAMTKIKIIKMLKNEKDL